MFRKNAINSLHSVVSAPNIRLIFQKQIQNIVSPVKVMIITLDNMKKPLRSKFLTNYKVSLNDFF